MRALCTLGLLLGLVACGSSKPAAPDEPVCGNGILEDNEACDDGADNGTTGCTTSCTFACNDPVVDCPATDCQIATCSAEHACASMADTSKDGMSCGSAGGICLTGECIVIPPSCGDGMTNSTAEQCDFGTDNGAGTGCTVDCKFECTAQADCDDGLACNGAEPCSDVTVNGQMGKTCTMGTSQANGTSCGTGMICINSACTNAICGDSFTTAPEECDDANSMMNDGCENTCKYTCLATDPMRNCTPADACAGQGTCSSTTHTCMPGTPLANNTPCGTGGYCKMGVCTQPVCGNNMVEPGEVCDHGLLNGTMGDGCKSNCQWVCVAAMDCGTPPACNMFSCTTAHTCQASADPSKNGMSCGTNLVCSNGACIAPSAVCGNGITETGEQCDFGTGNGAGTGCETNCQFSCTMMPNSCNDNNACNGVESCQAVTVMMHAGQKCFAGTPLADNTSCGTGKICKMQACVNSVCGDGYIDTMRGESCEPPNTATCDSMCRTIVCGDSIRAGAEQCDDGNLINIDGCSGTCKFEQSHRMNNLVFPFTGPYTFCTANKMGEAIVGGNARTAITDTFTAGVRDGSISVEFFFRNLDDLSGTNDASLQIGWISGTPATGAVTYNGNSDLDWWYTTKPADINASRVPNTLMPASIAAKVLTGTSTEVFITASFSGVIVTFDMFNSRFRATIGAVSTPLVSSNGMTPGHLPAEHLDPALQSFATMTNGEMCGNTTARSLANALVPAVLVGSTPCTENYAASNTLLDMMISGCRTFNIITQVAKTQPDQSRDGATYVFTANAQHQVVSCTRNGAAAALATCLDNAGYSTVFKIGTDRIIAK